MKIVDATLADWPEIRAIYQAGILTNNATFNTVTDIPTGEVWFAGKLAGFIIKAIDQDGVMLGWATLSPVSKRRVYQGVVEDSVYVADHAIGQGIAQALLADLIAKADRSGIWTIVASIFPENEASVYIHQKAGFQLVGTRQKIAQMHGEWRDVVWLERRSLLI